MLAQTQDGVDGVIHTYVQLKAPGPYPPDLLHHAHREAYLTAAEFKDVLGVSKSEFYTWPKWKRTTKKKDKGLF